MAKKKTYRDVDRGRIVVFGGEVYHWQRLTYDPVFDENGKELRDEDGNYVAGPKDGILIDGSGPARNGVEGKKKLVADLKKSFPNDVFEGA